MELTTVKLEIPADANIILGQTHFIKTIEDVYEIMATGVPGAKFGIAFNEASGPCLTRFDGNEEELVQAAVRNCQALAAGHTFNLIMRGAYPINVLNAIKQCPEVCSIYCATANPVDVIVARSEQGCGILGVIDGSSPAGVEGDKDREKRREFLRMIGYKR
jgi:adenosine/AMP kinase